MAHGLGQFGVMLLGLQLGMTAGMASVVMQTHAFFALLLAAQLLGETPVPCSGRVRPQCSAGWWWARRAAAP